MRTMLTEPERKLIDEAVYSIFPDLAGYDAQPLDNAVVDVIALRMSGLLKFMREELENRGADYVKLFLETAAKEYAGKVGS